MPRGVTCGTFRRHGACVIGQIGSLTARWDRHRGGVLAVVNQRGRHSDPTVEFSTYVRVRKGEHPWLASQANDADPRLIFCEEGPERLVMRVMYALVDDRGNYHGDGVSDTVLWANGEVQMASGVRLVDLTAHDIVTDAWIEARVLGQAGAVEVGARGRTRLVPSRLGEPRWFRLPGAVPKRFVLVRSGSACVAFGWFSDRGDCYEDLGGVGAWHGPGNEAPYYDRWGHLYDQWTGEPGWRAPSARLGVVGTGEGVAVRWCWLHDADAPATANMGYRALLALSYRDDADDARHWLSAFHTPIVPGVQEGRFQCLDVLENALVVKRTGEATRLTFRRDPLGRTAHVRVHGLAGTGGVVVSAPGGPIVPHLLSHGGVTDDPYGPNHVRPGDRYAPSIADPAVPADEVVFSVTLSRRGKTVVTVRETPGISLAYLKWDDRRTFVVRTSGLDAPLAEFSTRTLCLQHLRARAGAGPARLGEAHGCALERLPLYWYQINASSPFHCLNLLETFRLVENGPEALRFELVSHNRGQRARSSMRVVIPAACGAPTNAAPPPPGAHSPHPRAGAPQCTPWAGCATSVHVEARLDVLRQWDLPGIQYLNSFPENSREPRDWSRDWVVLVDAAGRVMERFFKERLDGQRRGDAITEWRDRLVFVQGAAARGNVFVYAANVTPPGQAHAYRLCGVWLDSHFEIVNLPAPVEAGSAFEVEYVLAVGGDASLTRAQAADIARKALAAGTLRPEWLWPHAAG